MPDLVTDPIAIVTAKFDTSEHLVVFGSKSRHRSEAFIDILADYLMTRLTAFLLKKHRFQVDCKTFLPNPLNGKC